MTRLHFGLGAAALALLVSLAWPAAGRYAAALVVAFLLYLLWCYHREEVSTVEMLRRHESGSSAGWTGDWL